MLVGKASKSLLQPPFTQRPISALYKGGNHFRYTLSANTYHTEQNGRRGACIYSTGCHRTRIHCKVSIILLGYLKFLITYSGKPVSFSDIQRESSTLGIKTRSRGVKSSPEGALLSQALRAWEDCLKRSSLSLI